MDFVKLGMLVNSRQLATANREMQKTAPAGAKAARSVKGVETAFAAAAKSVGVFLAAAAAIGGTISTISTFERSMSQVGAVTRATASEMEKMRAIAKELGRTTEFTAAQAGDGLRFLGQAGFDASEAVAALPAVLDLATASGMDLARAADIASNVLSGFGKEAHEAGEVSDILAATASRANTNVEQLGNAMSFAAPVAAALGIDVSETAAAIGKLSDAGIQGSRAGTGMRQILAGLASPTKAARDELDRLGIAVNQINPELHSFNEIVQLLADRGLSAASAMEIFGREAGPSILALTSQASGLTALTNELENVNGAAREMADTVRDDLKGDLDSLFSSLQGLVIALGEAGLTAVIRGIVQGLTLLARTVTMVVDAVASLPDLFSMTSQTSRALEAAIDSSTVAMGDQIRQTQRLEAALRTGNTMTVEAARVHLQSAEARFAEVEAIKAQNQELAKQASGFNDVVREIARARAESEELRSVQARAAEAGANLPGLTQDTASLAAEIEAADQRLADLLIQQTVILDTLQQQDYLSPEQESQLETAKANVERLRTALDEATDGMVTFGDETVQGVELTDRLTGALSGATSQTNSLADAMAGVGAEIASLQVGNIARAARLSALQAGASITSAGASADIAGKRAELSGALGSSDGAIRAGAVQELERFVTLRREQANLEEQIRSTLSSSRGGGGGGGGGGSSLGSKEMRDGMRDAQRVLESTRSEAEKYAMEVAKINELHRMFPEIINDEVAGRALDQLEETYGKASDFATDVAGSVSGAFKQLFSNLTGGSAEAADALENLGQKLLQVAAQRSVFTLLAKLAPSVFGQGGFIDLFNAKGNVFDNGKVQAFASGGVVQGASIFPMAGGKTGLMGEAGPEAILPLQRGSDGNLGVSAGGAGGGQTVIVENHGSPARTERSKGPDGREIVRVIVGEEMGRGSFDRSNQSRYGLAPQKVTR